LTVANWYERHLLPHLVDFACSRAPVRRERKEVVARARGRVLEVGIGTGLNLAHYDKSRVTRIVGLDPALEMQGLARRRMRRAGLDVELVALSAEHIPLADASVDSIVMTYTLCSIEDPRAALAEMRRVLAPGGMLLFSEHGLAPEESVRRWQRRLQPHWSRIAGGCHLDRDIPALLEEAG
jgi:ubiquinone/menaquinone biosynthesis C-methylase UbiE